MVVGREPGIGSSQASAANCVLLQVPAGLQWGLEDTERTVPCLLEDAQCQMRINNSECQG
jgi:hypothetical protein